MLAGPQRRSGPSVEENNFIITPILHCILAVQAEASHFTA